jgi:hypothetical protein
MSNNGNGRRIVLTPAQKAEYQMLRELGHSHTEARYHVLTPEQKHDLKCQIRYAERRRYEKNPYEEIIRAARNSANSRGVKFTITVDDLDWPEHCPVFSWIKLHCPGHHRKDPAGASLDRKDNSQGYVEDNVIVVSWRANSLRKDATFEELFALAKFYVPEDYHPDFYFPYESELDFSETDPFDGD